MRREIYAAHRCLGVARSGWTEPAKKRAKSYGGYVQLASGFDLLDAVEKSYPTYIKTYRELYIYQEEAVTELPTPAESG